MSQVAEEISAACSLCQKKECLFCLFDPAFSGTVFEQPSFCSCPVSGDGDTANIATCPNVVNFVTLNSDADCTFLTPNGEYIFYGFILVPAVIVMCVFACIVCSRDYTFRPCWRSCSRTRSSPSPQAPPPGPVSVVVTTATASAAAELTATTP